MKNNATRVIENLINGNCAYAKRGARHIGGETLRRAALEAGMSDHKALAAAYYLKTGAGWQTYCDTK